MGHDSNYTLENTYLRATFYKCEDRDVCSFNETGMLMDLVFKNPETGVQTAASDDFKFYFGDASPWSASGFSVLEDEGSSMGRFPNLA